MEKTVLCYIEKDGKYLMLYRNKEIGDPNAGMYIGVGGHMEGNETPDETLVREVWEETGLKLLSYKRRGTLVFDFDEDESLAYLYTSDSFEGEVKDDCEEGTLYWVDKGKIEYLPIYEGDKIFLDVLINSDDDVNIKLVYRNGKFIGWEKL